MVISHIRIRKKSPEPGKGSESKRLSYFNNLDFPGLAGGHIPRSVGTYQLPATI